ncbi:MAG: hypothetical protein WBN92_16850 [Terriglobia bacterium]
MTSSQNPPSQSNKTIVAFLDGRRLKGYIYNFSAIKNSFRLLPAEDPFHQKGIEVEMKDLKAVFFVKDFVGDPDHQRVPLAELPKHGRKIEVIFSDGEVIQGATETYNSQKPGFFMFPADSNSNNLRIFIVNSNVREVKNL